MAITKACSKCNQVKDLAEYYGDRRKKDGKVAECKDCWRIRERAKFASDPETKLAKNRASYRKFKERHIAKCKEYQSKHRKQYVQYTRNWIKRNVERVRASARRRHHLNPQPQRAQQLKRRTERYELVLSWYHKALAKRAGTGGFFTKEQWLSLVEDCNWSCVACGTHISQIEAIYPNRKHLLEVDHIIPYSKAGSSDISNIQPLCQECNNRKRAKAIDYRPPDVRRKYPTT